MPNACFLVGRVGNIPNLEMGEDKEPRATLNLELSFRGKNYGWIKVICLGEFAEFAANLHIGRTVAVVGRLIRGFYETGTQVWWEEIALIADYLEVIE